MTINEKICENLIAHYNASGTLYTELLNEVALENEKISESELGYIDAISKNALITPSKLAEILGVSKPAVTQVIKRLINKGYVEKKASSKDERFVSLSLTKKIDELTNKVDNKFLSIITEDFDEDELILFNKSIRKTLKAMRGYLNGH